MSLKGRFSPSEKLDAIQDYLSGKRGKNQICRDMQISDQTFYSWVYKYQKAGPEGLVSAQRHKHYPETVKMQAVKDYLDGKASLSEICRQYDISSHGLLHVWIKKYNGHETIKSSDLKGAKYMTMGRKTTFEERVEIVSYCIANNNDYKKAADKFQVSYQQIYIWVKKYEEQGTESLLDRRGKHKSPDKMSETEKLAAQLKLLEAENNRLKMEIDFLKKMDEMERGR